MIRSALCAAWKVRALACLLVAIGPAPAGAGEWYEVRTLELHAHDLVWHAASGRLLASAAADAGSRANAIVPIDPESGALGSPTPLGGEPFELALSDEGSRLYAGLDSIGAVQPVALPGLVPAAPWPLPSDTAGGTLHAGDLVVQPGSPDVVAVALHSIPVRDFPTGAGVVIFDSGVLRPAYTTAPADRIVFAEPGVLYGQFGAPVHELFWRMQVDEQGVRVVDEHERAIEGWLGGEIHVVGGRLYSSFGRVLEPSRPSYYGTYAMVEQTTDVAVDLAAGLVYFLEENGVGIYDLAHFVRLAEIPVPELATDRSSLVLWRTGHLAFRAGSRVYLVDATLPDTDGDGHGDPRDNCRLASNASQADADADRVGGACDPDDRVPDVPLAVCEDSIEHNAARLTACLFAAGFEDADGDDEYDPRDHCPGTAPRAPVDDSGCSVEQFCAAQGVACEAADWRNDEPKGKPHDCERVGNNRTGFVCRAAAARGA